MSRPFIICEYRPHAKAAASYALIDQSAVPGHQHLGTFHTEDEAEAICDVLNGAERVYRAALRSIADREPF